MLTRSHAQTAIHSSIVVQPQHSKNEKFSPSSPSGNLHRTPSPRRNMSRGPFVKSDSMKRLRADGALCKSESVKNMRLEGPELWSGNDGAATAVAASESPVFVSSLGEPTPRLRAGLLQKTSGFYKSDETPSPKKRLYKSGPLIRAGLLQKNDPFYNPSTNATDDNDQREPMADIDIHLFENADDALAFRSPASSPSKRKNALRRLGKEIMNGWDSSFRSISSTSYRPMPVVPIRDNAEHDGRTIFEAAPSLLEPPLLATPEPVIPVATILVGERVRFRLASSMERNAATPDGSTANTATIQTEVYACSIELSAEEVQTLWWTKLEQKGMKRRARLAAARVLSCPRAYEFRLAAEQLLLHSFHEAGAASSIELNSLCREDGDEHDSYAAATATSASLSSRVDPFSYEDAVRIMIHHGARGKEQAMINACKLESCRFYYKCDKVCAQRVLQAQADAKRLYPMEPERVALLIALEQNVHSAFAGNFARMLADGDAQAAAGLYNDEPPSMSTLISDDLDEEVVIVSSLYTL